MPPPLDFNTESELHQYAVYLHKEVESYKTMIENRVQNSRLNDTVHFTDQVITYNDRLAKLESLMSQLGAESDDHSNT